MGAIMKRDDAIKKVTEMINDVGVCMLTNIDEHGQVISRPMATADVDKEGNVWFFTNEYSGKITQISENNELNLIYAHPGHNTYLNIFGIGSIVIDKEKMKQLWTPVVKAWFPDGIDDPKLCLLRVDTKQAWYWDNSSSKMIIFFNMLTAIIRGKQFEDGDTGELNLD
ncbi:MAG: pyridoxamine 5'-phosphate oxidase-related FMN-binding [Bacteroidetes bacterium]|nr:pyridoxamine 5'-phosphate oxidase-related FMN-binding [Bacteroidota bacterium]